MIQTAVVFLIIGIAVVYTIRTFYRGLTGKAGCGCSCSGCGSSADCSGQTEISDSPLQTPGD